jgi:hypothetical protein
MSYIGRQLNVPASTVQRTAEGAITAGKAVASQSNGTVTAISSIAAGFGSEVVFESASSRDNGITYDTTNDKVVIVYQDTGNSGYGTAVVGTVSGKAISFGTPVVFESAATTYNVAAFDSTNDKVVVAYRDEGNSNYGTAIVGTVSGTSISFGSAVVFESARADYITIAYDVNAQKAVIAYRDFSNSLYGTAIVGTVSGTSISFGTAVVFESAYSNMPVITYEGNAQKVVIAYSDADNSNYGTAIVGTVSGTSISFGTAAVFESATTQYIGIGFDSTANKVIVAYSDDGNSGYVTAVVGTVSGTGISFGTPVVVASNNSQYATVTYNSASNTTFVSWMSITNSNYGAYALGTVSGTSISFSSSAFFASAHSSYQAAVYDPDQEAVVIAYTDQGNSSYGTAIAYQDFSSNANSFIGFAEEDATANGLATIQLGGSVNDKQTSLTAGQTYFVQTDGTIGTTADSPSVTAGTAVSSTEILVKG